MMENLMCPICNGPMTSRMNGSTGQRFWGCDDYPRCRGTRNTDGEAPTRQNSQRRPQPETDAVEETPSERARRLDRGRWRV